MLLKVCCCAQAAGEALLLLAAVHDAGTCSNHSDSHHSDSHSEGDIANTVVMMINFDLVSTFA